MSFEAPPQSLRGNSPLRTPLVMSVSSLPRSLTLTELSASEYDAGLADAECPASAMTSFAQPATANPKRKKHVDSDICAGCYLRTLWQRDRAAAARGILSGDISLRQLHTSVSPCVPS